MARFGSLVEDGGYGRGMAGYGRAVEACSVEARIGLLGQVQAVLVSLGWFRRGAPGQSSVRQLSYGMVRLGRVSRDAAGKVRLF